MYEEMLREVYGKDGRQAGMPSNNLMPAKIWQPQILDDLFRLAFILEKAVGMDR